MGYTSVFYLLWGAGDTQKERYGHVRGSTTTTTSNPWSFDGTILFAAATTRRHQLVEHDFNTTTFGRQ